MHAIFLVSSFCPSIAFCTLPDFIFNCISFNNSGHRFNVVAIAESKPSVVAADSN